MNDDFRKTSKIVSIALHRMTFFVAGILTALLFSNKDILVCGILGCVWGVINLVMAFTSRDVDVSPKCKEG